MVRITDIEAGSLAARAGILPGETLLSINAHDIQDVLDYRFYLTERTVCLEIQADDGTVRQITLHKAQYADIGLCFATPLMDKKQTCRNRCIFCFIDQLPRGMRESLYFKDDDARLSFLHGNYITLTNLDDRDIDRIIAMKITPVNISVHTMNPTLRCRMMHNKRAGEVLRYLRRLADAGIELRCQIVLCRGVNDGEELTYSMRELAKLFPAVTSTSIVPAGLTAHREGLYPLQPYTSEECAEIIRQVTAFGDACVAQHGHRLFFCADELYVSAGLPLPPDRFYEGYMQIENGVGMLTSLREEFEDELKYIDEYDRSVKRTVSLATGEAAYDFLCALVEKAEKLCYNLTCHVYKIENRYFGGGVTVAGLLTGKDVAEQLWGCVLGEELLISRNMLRAEGDLFLCGMTPAELAEKLGVKVRPVESDGRAFLRALLGVPDEGETLVESEENP